MTGSGERNQVALGNVKVFYLFTFCPVLPAFVGNCYKFCVAVQSEIIHLEERRLMLMMS